MASVEMKATRIMVRGITPLLMHNGQLADPLSPATQALSRAAKKKAKTDADHLDVRRLEWYGSLYLDDDGHPIVPSEMMEAAIVEGARRMRKGREAVRGIVLDGHARLIYKGPKTADGLWAAGKKFVKTAGVKVQRNRVIRTRPMFTEWAAEFVVMWDDSEIQSDADLAEILAYAGRSGIGDWRPKFGRFEVEVLS